MLVTRRFSEVSRFSRIISNGFWTQKSYVQRCYSTQPKINAQYTSSDAAAFKSLFPKFTKDLIDQVRKYDETVAPAWFEKSLQYNILGGKNNRGQMTVIAYKMLANESQLTKENLELAQYIGWCSEMFEAALFLVDDILDGSETRRGLPCWYKLKEVEMQSITDITMLENAVFTALKQYIGQKEYYPELFRMFGEANFITSLGQTLDFLVTKENVTNHTMDRYQGIVKHKTSHSAFYLPVAFALRMCGYKDPQIYREAKEVFDEIGLFFQTRNDYLDIFGDMTETGKGGTDIPENKISWMAIRTLEKADSDQRAIMSDCYGQKDPIKILQVQSLYTELEIDKEFEKYEQESYDRITSQIERTNFDRLKPVMKKVWDIIYYKV